MSHTYLVNSNNFAQDIEHRDKHYKIIFFKVSADF